MTGCFFLTATFVVAAALEEEEDYWLLSSGGWQQQAGKSAGGRRSSKERVSGLRPQRTKEGTHLFVLALTVLTACFLAPLVAAARQGCEVCLARATAAGARFRPDQVPVVGFVWPVNNYSPRSQSRRRLPVVSYHSALRECAGDGEPWLLLLCRRPAGWLWLLSSSLLLHVCLW